MHLKKAGEFLRHTMTDDQRKAYTKRITAGNPTEIIVTMFDMLLGDFSDAENEISSEHRDEEKINLLLRHAEAVIIHLKSALDFKYEIAKNLFSLYDYSQREIAKAIYSLDSSHIENARNVMSSLAESFREIKDFDKRDSLTENAETTVAGMTYGRNGIDEVTANYDRNRGFLA